MKQLFILAMATVLTAMNTACSVKADSIPSPIPQSAFEAPPAEGSTPAPATADFSVWNELVGYYKLKSFNGEEKDLRSTEIEASANTFFDRATQRSLKSVIFPLYSAVSSGYDSSFDFGPVEGLGVTTVTEENGMKTYKYSYNGPATYEGRDITFSLDMTVLKDGTNLHVIYSLSVPGHINQTTNTFVLTK